MEFTISHLIRKSKVRTAEEVKRFHAERLAALKLATDIYTDRAASYNVDADPSEEMVYGVVSLASEIFKRGKRMANLLTPTREESLREADVKRILDTCTDLINYSSWMYGLMQVALGKVDYPEYGAALDRDAAVARMKASGQLVLPYTPGGLYHPADVTKNEDGDA